MGEANDCYVRQDYATAIELCQKVIELGFTESVEPICTWEKCCGKVDSIVSSHS
jgi:hypothetical protein